MFKWWRLELNKNMMQWDDVTPRTLANEIFNFRIYKKIDNLKRSQLGSTEHLSSGMSWDGTLRQIDQSRRWNVCPARFVHSPFDDIFLRHVLRWLLGKMLQFWIKTFHTMRQLSCFCLLVWVLWHINLCRLFNAKSTLNK